MKPPPRPHVLTHDDVHRIRTEGMPDTHWERLLGVSRTCVQKARVGVTWQKHPTPPDKAERVNSQRAGGRKETNNLPQMSSRDQMVSRALIRWPRVTVLHEKAK